MHVKMEDRLSCNLSIVRKNIETLEVEGLDDCPRNCLRCMKYIVQIRFRYMQEVQTVGLWNYQGVAVVYRVDIEN